MLNSNFIRTISLTSFLFFTVPAIGQTLEAVLNFDNGRSRRTVILQLDEYEESIRVIEIRGKDSLEFGVNDLVSYSYDSIIYERYTYRVTPKENRTAFMKVLKGSKLKLLELAFHKKRSSIVTPVVYKRKYILLRGEEQPQVYNLKNTPFRKYYIEYFKGNSQIISKFIKGFYSQQEMHIAIDEYNNWLDVGAKKVSPVIKGYYPDFRLLGKTIDLEFSPKYSVAGEVGKEFLFKYQFKVGYNIPLGARDKIYLSPFLSMLHSSNRYRHILRDSNYTLSESIQVYSFGLTGKNIIRKNEYLSKALYSELGFSLGMGKYFPNENDERDWGAISGQAVGSEITLANIFKFGIHMGLGQSTKSVSLGLSADLDFDYFKWSDDTRSITIRDGYKINNTLLIDPQLGVKISYHLGVNRK